MSETKPDFLAQFEDVPETNELEIRRAIVSGFKENGAQVTLHRLSLEYCKAPKTAYKVSKAISDLQYLVRKQIREGRL